MKRNNHDFGTLFDESVNRGGCATLRAAGTRTDAETLTDNDNNAGNVRLADMFMHICGESMTSDRSIECEAVCLYAVCLYPVSVC